MVSIKEKRTQQGISQVDLAKAIGKDVPMLSKFENYVCLPTPEDAKRIVKALKCTTILELYNEKDITFLPKAKSKGNKEEELNTYKLTAELPREAVNWLTKENLKLLGFNTVKEWANDCYRKFVKRVEKKKSHLEGNQNDSMKE